MLIGRKKIFAIEYELVNGSVGKLQMWLNNKKVGQFEDIVYLSYLQSALLSIVSRKKELQLFSLNYESPEKIVEEVLRLKADISNGWIDGFIGNFGESFDDFIIIHFIKDDYIYFIWKLVDSPYFGYPKSMYQRVQEAQVEYEFFEKVVNEFSKLGLK